jgi:hypothetical protein
MSITHIVLFQFKAGTDTKVIKDVRPSSDPLFDVISKLTARLRRHVIA